MDMVPQEHDHSVILTFEQFLYSIFVIWAIREGRENIEAGQAPSKKASSNLLIRF